MNLSKGAQVLIVGAGPTGLVAANYLAKHGVKIRVIDKLSARTDKSKALGVQSGTMECLDHFLSPKITEEMVAKGMPARQASIHINNRDPIDVDLTRIDSPYNFILILPQSETERILEQSLNALNISVERNTELLTLQQDDNGITCEIKRADGASEAQRTDFVLGCDGAHSRVRQQLKIPFAGTQYSGDFILGDVKLRWPWPNNSINTFVCERGVIAAFPMTQGMYRLVLIPKTTPPNADVEISFNEFRSQTSYLSQNRIEVLESTWLTRFRVHHRIVTAYGQGRAFLVGDAAHIHSPAGGQGMNIGIQDALNLCSKIREVLAGKNSMDLLQNYEKERRPIAKAVLRGTDLAFRMALFKENSLLRGARRLILPRLVTSQWIQKFVVQAISEVKAAREEIQRE